MAFRVQSIPWLVAHEMRLTWRGLRRGGASRWRVPVIGAIFGLTMLGLGVPLAVSLYAVQLPVSSLAVAGGLGIVLYLLTLGVSLAIRAATDAFYDRGDLDLLFSSPLDGRVVLFVRSGVIAINIFLGSALFVTPFLLPVALVRHKGWFCAYLVMASTAMAATSVGLTVTVLLFRVLGPRRTRGVAQLLALIFGSGVFLASQAPALFGKARVDHWLAQLGAASASKPWWRDLPSWPFRALVGEPGPLAAVLTLAFLLFLATTYWVGHRFTDDAARASSVATPSTVRQQSITTFSGGLFAATVRKELRLLRRDITLLTQVFARLFYLLPLTFILVRNAYSHLSIAIPTGVALVTLFAGQTANAMVWITIAAEDAPDLIASSPASPQMITRAKLTAALAPLGLLLMGPLAILTYLDPWAGLAACLGCGVNGFANGIVGLKLQKPAPRSTFRRRGAESITAGVVGFVISVIIAGAAGLAAAHSIFAAIPLLIAGAALILIYQL